LSVGADVLKQIVCSIKIRRAPHARHDNIDFKPIITRISENQSTIRSLDNKVYDSEKNHVLKGEYLMTCSIGRSLLAYPCSGIQDML
jgi:hypothetical protein